MSKAIPSDHSNPFQRLRSYQGLDFLHWGLEQARGFPAPFSLLLLPQAFVFSHGLRRKLKSFFKFSFRIMIMIIRRWGLLGDLRRLDLSWIRLNGLGPPHRRKPIQDLQKILFETPGHLQILESQNQFIPFVANLGQRRGLWNLSQMEEFDDHRLSKDRIFCDRLHRRLPRSDRGHQAWVKEYLQTQLLVPDRKQTEEWPFQEKATQKLPDLFEV